MEETVKLPTKEELAARLDALRDAPVDILGSGQVRLIDVMGSDEDIVRAAKISYGRSAAPLSFAEVQRLIRYLYRQGHTSPFEMAEMKFYIRIPMDVQRQHVRHRTASLNEYSTRYSEAIDECLTTGPNEWRMQSTDNKQGSSGCLSADVGEMLTEQERALHQHARDVYNARLKAGVAKEQARKDLPLSNYTEMFWKMDLHNLLHYLRLRMDSHAQFEIRMLANAISGFVSQMFPITWQAFLDYTIDAVKLSGAEVAIIRALLTSEKSSIDGPSIEYALAKAAHELGKTESKALSDKLRKLGITITN